MSYLKSKGTLKTTTYAVRDPGPIRILGTYYSSHLNMRYFEIKNRKLTLENTERMIKNEQSRETGNNKSASELPPNLTDH
jgi:hypothetical protein